MTKFIEQKWKWKVTVINPEYPLKDGAIVDNVILPTEERINLKLGYITNVIVVIGEKEPFIVSAEIIGKVNPDEHTYKVYTTLRIVMNDCVYFKLGDQWYEDYGNSLEAVYGDEDELNEYMKTAYLEQ